MADPARSFGSVAAAYDRGRPSYPAPAVAWMLDGTSPSGSDALAVLEVGAGTGKLTQGLVEAGCDVFATDPDDAMLDILSAHLPDVRATRAAAEQLPVPDHSVDVVAVGQAFHWLDPEQAVPELARVLRPGGHIAIVANLRDESIPWVKKFGRILGQPARDFDPTEALEADGYFATTDHTSYTFWQEVDRATLVDLALSRSGQAMASDEERTETQAKVEALYDDYGRGTGGMQVPYVCHVWRARVTEKHIKPEPIPEPVAPRTYLNSHDPFTDTAVALPRVLDTYGFDLDGTDEIKVITWH